MALICSGRFFFENMCEARDTSAGDLFLKKLDHRTTNFHDEFSFPDTQFNK